MEEERIPINDGGGLYDNLGLIDTLIIDMNNLIRRAMAGEYIAFCTTAVSIVQRLSNLKTGVKHDMDCLKEQLEEYQKGDGE